MLKSRPEPNPEVGRRSEAARHGSRLFSGPCEDGSVTLHRARTQAVGSELSAFASTDRGLFQGSQTLTRR